MRFPSVFRANLLALASLVSLSLATPVPAQEVSGLGIEEILKRGKLIAAVQTQGPPVSFVNRDGARVGHAIDLVKLMAEDMGVELEMRDFDFRGLIPAAVAGQVDIIAADMAPTPSRSLQLSFSNEFYAEPVVLYAQRESGFSKAEELNRSGLSIAVAQGSANRRILERDFPEAAIVEFAGGGPALAQAAAADRVDAVINTRSSARANIESYGKEFMLLEGELYVWPESFAVRPERLHLLNWINNWLYWKRRDGVLDELASYWRAGNAWRKDHM